jgi:hypothetical protein
VKVADHAGETWNVRRRWLPWRPRLRDGAFELGTYVVDVADGFPLLLFLLGLVLIPVAVLLAVFVAEIALVLLFVSLLTFGRSIFVGRWPIEVFRGDALVHVEAVRGWADSRRRMLAMVDGIRRGDPPRSASRHRADGGDV